MNSLPLKFLVCDLGYSPCQCPPFTEENSGERCTTELCYNVSQCNVCKCEYRFRFPWLHKLCIVGMVLLPLYIFFSSIVDAWEAATVLQWTGAWRLFTLPLFWMYVTRWAILVSCMDAIIKVIKSEDKFQTVKKCCVNMWNGMKFGWWWGPCAGVLPFYNIMIYLNKPLKN